MKWIVAYCAAALAFGALDAVWLRWAGPNFYRPAIGELLADSFRMAPALVFYAAYIAAMVWFAVRPGLAGGIGAAALNGWPVHVTLADIAWGAFATAVAASVATWAAGRFA